MPAWGRRGAQVSLDEDDARLPLPEAHDEVRRLGETLNDMLERRPEEVIRLAVRGMLPKNRLARKQLTKLKIYAGPEHPHAAQQPQKLEITT